MADIRRSARVAGLATALVPMAALSMVVLLVGGAGHAGLASSDCGAAGTGQTIAGVDLDADQLSHAQTVVAVTAGRGLPSYAAVVAVATSYTEVKLRNQLAKTGHDSVGLFQQRVSIYSAPVAADPVKATNPVAADPVKATNAFLDRLVALPGWETTAVGLDSQAVQRSAYPGRYQPNAGLAEQLVGQLWPSASAAALTADLGMAAAIGPAVCAEAGGGGGAGAIVGPTGTNVAGTTTIPDGLVINGTAPGVVAVRYALAQLGKPYVWAAAGPDAFDCSGLTMAAWAAAGVPLPHLAAGQTSYGRPGPADLSEAVGGDLVMIPGADGTAAQPGHVGMVVGYVDAPDGRHLYLVQAPTTGIPVELTEATRWSGQIVAVRHIA